MSGDMSIGQFKHTLDQFRTLRDERPKEEKWELAGSPVMLPPPKLGHQRIAAVLMELLNANLASSKPEWEANMEIGLLTEDETYNPEPDVTVIDRGTPSDQTYASRFYFVAEILSPSDKPKVLALKRGYYEAHESCLGVIFVQPDKVAAELLVRKKGWRSRELITADDRIVIPEIGDIGAFIDLYRRTELHPSWQRTV